MKGTKGAFTVAGPVGLRIFHPPLQARNGLSGSRANARVPCTLNLKEHQNFEPWILVAIFYGKYAYSI